tara:strand:+ start:8522 stop:8728 length:207 start_codon:yes stop_codon:yes gene_type:complete
MSCLKCNKEYQVFTDEFTGEIEIYHVDELYCIDCEMATTRFCGSQQCADNAEKIAKEDEAIYGKDLPW